MVTLTQPATLYLVCGKIASGKSTLAQQLGNIEGCVLLAEDTWLSTLYPTEQTTLDDYINHSRRLRDVLRPHLIALLKLGVSPVLDFALNTPKLRQWAKNLAEEAGAIHQLHFLNLTDAHCKQRLRQRNLSGQHPYQTSDEQYDIITYYFSPPDETEGLTVIEHKES